MADINECQSETKRLAGSNAAPGQRPVGSQPLYGSQEGMANPGQSSVYGQPQPNMQQPPSQPGQPSGAPAPGSQFSGGGPGYQQGPGGPGGPAFQDNTDPASQLYDPQNPQLGGHTLQAPIAEDTWTASLAIQSVTLWSTSKGINSGLGLA